MKKRQAFPFESGNTVLVDELCTRGPGGDGGFEHSSAGQFSLGALFAAEPHRPRKGGILTVGNTEKLSAPILRRTGAPDGKSLYVSAPVPDADSGAGASCRECTDGALLDLVAAGGCGVLLWGSLLEEAQKLCEQVESWRSFLLGFLPVYAGVLTMGGEGAAGSAASGALLTALCFLAQLAAGFVQPLLHCYLMLSMACCVSSEPALGVFCKGVGSALRQALGWAGKILVALLGLQRAAAFQLDRFSLRAGQLLAGSVPIIGQTLSSASESILAGIQLLKSGLGLAALSVLGAEFVPLYLGLMIQLALLMGCSLLCSLTGISAAAHYSTVLPRRCAVWQRWWRFSSDWRRQGWLCCSS